MTEQPASRDFRSSPGAPSGAYTVDFAGIIDGENPSTSFHDGFREGSKRGLYLLNQFAAFLDSSKNIRLALFQAASALGLSIADGKSDAEIAAACGAGTRACVSKGRLHFQRACDIKPLPNQKTAEARQKYSKTRKIRLYAN